MRAGRSRPIERIRETMETDTQHVDVLVIGGGVVGCAILRELARYQASLALVERNPDICEGTSKSNSAIVHTGFDAPPGSFEARLLANARGLWPSVIEDLHIPYLQIGALMLAVTPEDLLTIEHEIIPNAERNGVTLRRLTREEILENAPYVNPEVLGGLLVESEGVIDPFWTTRAYCESAVLNGAAIFTGEGVSELRIDARHVFVRTSSGRALTASLVVNAAGLWSDEVARLAGDTSFTIRPRKGQFVIVEEDHGIAHIILPVPNKVSKGILVTPIIFGGILLGPTAEDVEEKNDLATTAEGLRLVRAGARKCVPGVADAQSVRQFAGLRAVGSENDSIIRPSTAGRRLLHVAGIRSTGLSASPAIGRYVGELVRDELGLALREDFQPELPEYLAAARKNEGDVLCLCRSITRGEILAALRSPLPPASLDSLLLAALESHGPAPDRRCHGLAHDALQPTPARLGSGCARRAEYSSLDPTRHPADLLILWRRALRSLRAGYSRGRGHRGSAGGALWPDLLRAGRCQSDLWHRGFYPAQYRLDAANFTPWPGADRGLDTQRTDCLRAGWRNLRRGGRSAVAARWPGHHRQRRGVPGHRRIGTR
jgi:glycerol-3-phosphate dehydrogenase